MAIFYSEYLKYRSFKEISPHQDEVTILEYNSVLQKIKNTRCGKYIIILVIYSNGLELKSKLVRADKPIYKILNIHK